MHDDLTALESLPLPASKEELLRRIAPARAALERVVDRLDHAQLTAPGHEGWSVKDHLAHIATWERLIVAHLRGNAEHELVSLDASSYERLSLDKLNERIRQLHGDRPAPEVRALFAEAHAEVLSLLQELDDATFARAYWDDEPAGRTVMEKVTGDTYRHYLEHLRWVEELLVRLIG